MSIPRSSTSAAGCPTLNYHPVMTADGRWIQLGNLLEHLFYAFMDAADLTELFAEEQWQGGPAEWTPEALEEMRDRILERMQGAPGGGVDGDLPRLGQRRRGDLHAHP